MKVFKKVMACLLVGTMAVSLGACGKKPAGSGNRKQSTLNISVFDGGYGTTFLDNIVSSFEAEYPGVDVVIEKTDLMDEIKQQVQADRYVADIILTSSSYISEGAKGKVLDITDVYESFAYGEDGTVTIKEKLAEAAEAGSFDGKYFQLPIHSGSTGLVYNKVYLDAIYGEDGYELPVTTNELIEMCNDIKAKNGWATVYTCSTDAEYSGWLRDVWTVQYMGYEDYKNFYDLSYTDVSGNVKKAESASELTNALKPARESALKALASFSSSKNGFAPESSSNMSFQQAQAYFIGFTSQNDVKEVGGHKGAAFMVNGDWLYGEVERYAEEVEVDVRFMRTPVNSQIIDKLSTVTNEAQLVECVKYIDSVIDEKEGTRPEYLSEEDYNRLYDARCMVWTTHGQQIATIPTTCQNETAAKDFLKFIASDTSALVYSDALNGMNSIFNNNVCSESKLNTFTTSLNDAFKEPVRVTILNSPYTAYGDLNFFRIYYFNQELFKCTDVDATVKSMIDWNADNLNDTWDNIVESYQTQ